MQDDDRVSNDDSQAKAQMGHLWAKASGGKCIYLMATQSADGMNLSQQLAKAVAPVGGA